MPRLEGMMLGAYRILQRVGGGGMGDIYLAEQVELGRRVAIKVLRDGPDKGSSQTEAARLFTQEARVIAALEHPNILPVYDFGLQDDVYYLVMQYVPDGSLADLLAPGPQHLLNFPIAPALVASIVGQAADALQYAHDNGVIHRDIKPHNLLIRVLSRPSAEAPAAPLRLHVLLADFGLARIMADLAKRTSSTGTPLYSAPEQYHGRPVAASDQYALACVAYLLLAGRPVFDGAVAELHHQHLTVEPTPLTHLRPALPPQASAVMARALAKAPEARYPRIQDFGAALAASLADTPHTGALAHPTAPPIVQPMPLTPAVGTAVPANMPGADTPYMPPTSYRAPMSSPLPSSLQPHYAGPHSRPTGSSPIAPAMATAVQPNPLREPDAPGAPVPRPLRRQGQTPFWRRRWVVLTLVAVVVLAIIGPIGYVRFLRPSPPQAAAAQFGTVTRVGTINMGRLAPLRAGTQPSQATIAQRALNPGQQNATSADSITGLAALPSTLPALDPNPAASILQAKYGLGQGQVGLSSPMSTSIAANNQNVIEVVDGAFQVFGYNGQPDWQAVTTADFFAPILQKNNALGQIRILFDTSASRWVSVANELTLQDGNVTHSYFDVAVSQSADPFSLWALYQIDTQEGANAGCTWADSPQLGINGAAIYVTGISFACGENGAFRGTMLWELPYRLFAAGVPSGAAGARFVRWMGVFKNTQRHVVFGLAPAIQPGGGNVEWLISNDAGYVVNGTTSKQVIVWTVLNPEAEQQNVIPTITGSVLQLPKAYADPPAAIQAQTSAPLTTGDARMTSAYFTSGHLYAAFTTAANWQGDTATRSGVYWIDIVPTANTPSATAPSGTAPTSTAAPLSQVHIGLSLTQSNVLGAAKDYFSYPALVADPSGNVAVVATLSSPDDSPGLILARHSAQDAPGVMSTALSLAKGLQAYNGSHWGDFLGVCLSVQGDSTPATLWVAGPYMTNYPTHWQTLVWQTRLQ